MPKPRNIAAVKQLTALFQESNAAVLTEYRGLSVAQLTRAALDRWVLTRPTRS